MNSFSSSFVPSAALIDQYLAGECSAEECTHIDAWLGEAPERRLAVDRMRVMRVAETIDWDVETGWRELVATIGEVNSEPRVNGRAERVQAGREGHRDESRRPALWGENRSGKHSLHLGELSLRWGMVVGAAAVAALVTLVSWRHVSSPAAVTKTFATAAGQQANITLGDGTHVVLAPRTTLRLVDFGKSARTVVLENGDAFFNVTHVSGVPFVVRVGKVNAQVLGTSFMVRHSAHDARVHVAVADGKVRVSMGQSAAAPSTLTAGSIYDATDSTVRTSRVDEIAPSTEWMQGQLVFHHTPVATVLRAMSQWYGYHFRYVDSTFTRRPVTVGLSVQSPAEALATLERVLKVNVTVTGDTVTLAPQPGRRVKQGIPRTRKYEIWMPTREVGR